jgi:hypothetical protein
MTSTSSTLIVTSCNIPTINPGVTELPNHPVLETFELFVQLPPELRLTIWRTTFERRTVKVSGHEKEADDLDDGDFDKWESLSLITPNPITLFVNKESRYETLRFYKPLFPKLTQGSPIYFFPSLDSFTPPTKEASQFSWDSERLGNLAFADPGSTDLIQSVGIENVFWSQLTSVLLQELNKAKDNVDPTIFSFHNLRELVLQTEEWFACENVLMTLRGRGKCRNLLISGFQAAQIDSPEFKIPTIDIRLPHNRVSSHETSEVQMCCRAHHKWQFNKDSQTIALRRFGRFRERNTSLQDEEVIPSLRCLESFGDEEG